MTVRTKNYARQVTAIIEDATNEGLNAAASFLTLRCREAVNISVFPRSKPGEPPRRETGWGRKHIKYTRANKSQGARVGIDISEVSPIHRKTAIYMIWLELGTSRIRPRPWLVATLLRFLKEIGRTAVNASKAKAGAA